MRYELNECEAGCNPSAETLTCSGDKSYSHSGAFSSSKSKKAVLVPVVHSWRLCDSAWSPVKFKSEQSVLGNLLWAMYMCHCHPFLNIRHQKQMLFLFLWQLLLSALHTEETSQYRQVEGIKSSISSLRFQVVELLSRSCKLPCTQLYSPQGLPQQPPLTSSSGTRFTQYPCFGWRGENGPLYKADGFVQLLPFVGFSSLSWGYHQSLNRAVLQNHTASNAKCILNKTRCSVWKSVQGLAALRNDGSKHSWPNLDNTMQIFQAIFSHLYWPHHFHHWIS